jgi:hypothetical protein
MKMTTGYLGKKSEEAVGNEQGLRTTKGTKMKKNKP